MILADAVKRASPEGKPVTLVLHDWGCVWGFEALLRDSDVAGLVSRVVVFDVGLMELTWPMVIGAGILYQYWAIMAWLLRYIPLVGDWFAERVVDLLFAVISLRTTHLKREKFLPAMCYPYLYFHINFWLTPNKLKWASADLKEFPKGVPVCFFWGARNKMIFHSKKWTKALEARTDGSRVMPMQTEHWIMREDPEGTHLSMEDFFAATAGGAKVTAAGGGSLRKRAT